MAYIHNGMLFNTKRNKVPIHAALCMNLKDFLLSERSPTSKVTYYVIPFI